MKEFYYKKIKRIEHIYRPKFFKALMGWEDIYIYKNGIMVINEKGETRKIWEK